MKHYLTSGGRARQAEDKATPADQRGAHIREPITKDSLQREREREIERYIDIYIYTYRYSLRMCGSHICIYTHIFGC